MVAKFRVVAALVALEVAGLSKATTAAFLVVVVVVKLYSLVITRPPAVPTLALTAQREPVVVAAAV
jgi:hypothetical protein